MGGSGVKKNGHRIITFGEIMLRLNPAGYLRMVQSDSLEASFSGAEANVAVSLACFGEDAAFVSRVPGHEIGDCAVNALRRYGVDTRYMLRGGERLGVYYVEKGASQRRTAVIYDRAHSAFAEAAETDFDWERIFYGADWFHFSGITPALGGALPEICMNACRYAAKAGIKVSCDINYRKKLWTPEQAGAVLSGYMPYVNVCIATLDEAGEVFGIRSDAGDADKAAEDTARGLRERFGCEKIALITNREESAFDCDWGGMLYAGGKACHSKRYKLHIVDRVGGGDSFGAALIHAELKSMPPQTAVEFAAAASCLKHSIEHDFNLITEDEVLALMEEGTSGGVKR